MLNILTVLALTGALACSAYAAKDDRWHRHSTFGWAVNVFGQYYLESAEDRARGPVFGLRFVCTPIREDRAAFDFAAGADAGFARGTSTYRLGSAYADVRVYIWLWAPFYLQGGAGITLLAASEAGGDIIIRKRNAGKSFFVGPAFQFSPAFMVLPEWRWDAVSFGSPPYLRGCHQSWRILINLN